MSSCLLAFDASRGSKMAAPASDLVSRLWTTPTRIGSLSSSCFSRSSFVSILCSRSGEGRRNRLMIRSEAESQTQSGQSTSSDEDGRKKVVVVGAGWAGLGAAHHLSKQGLDVTLLEAGPQPGGLVAGWKTPAGRSVEVGIHGFWYPYKNIFGLVDELGLQPFTTWTRSAQYSPAGLEHYLSLIDFDNSDAAWRKYDTRTARELFRESGCSERVYNDAFNPMLLVGLFAPGEQCSAAATIGMLYYFIIAHQADFDVVWCRGTVGEKIFKPWIEAMENKGLKFLSGKRVTDVILDDATGEVTGVACGEETFDADAVVISVGITALQRIVANSSVLKTREEFVNTANLGGIDVLAVRLWLDRKVKIPKPSNACFGFDSTTGWTFFDLNFLHDEYRDEPGTVVEADFYHANQFLPLSDEQVVQKVQMYLTQCIPEFGKAKVVDQAVVRFRKAVTHFSPGSYPYMMEGETSFPNVFMAGDWIKTQHGSWSQEKAFVTGLEAANKVLDFLNTGSHAPIIPVEPDEPHVRELRRFNNVAKDLLAQAGVFSNSL